MAEFVEVLKLAHEKEFQKLKDAIGANDLINAIRFKIRKSVHHSNTSNVTSRLSKN